MILQRLVEHYDRLEASGTVKLVPPGFSLQKVSFCVVLERNGSLNSFLTMQDENAGKTKPKSMFLPGATKSSGNGENPCFLWDRTSYLLGWTEDPDKKKQARAPKLFEAFRRRHLQYQKQFNDGRFDTLCTFLEGWHPSNVPEYLHQLQGISRDCGVFKITGEQSYLHDLFTMPVDWNASEKESKRSSVSVSGPCLVTGQNSEIARLHKPEIKGVFNSPPRGVPFVSMDKEAYSSYGKDQGFNAPVGTVAVFKYANTLNHLLSLRDRHIGLGDVTVVFWADHATPTLDCLAEMFGGLPSPADDALAPKEDQQRVDEARRLLTQLRDGTRNAPIKPDDEPTKFYILGLSPNASRLSIRLWIEAAAPELECRLGEHLRDLALKSNFDKHPLSIRILANATGRYQPNGKTKFDTKGVSPQLVGELARSVLTGAAYPQSFLATMVRRIRSDRYVGYERVSAIKACLVRNSRLRGAPQEISVELDDQQTDVAYRCGRLFALLEKAQIAALGKELNSTIKDRFFAAASATPALIFPRLFRLNTHHLAKLKQGSRGFYTNAFGELMGEPFAFPRQLSLEQQGRFFIGYFQERQYRPATKANSPEETVDTDE
jgi:CRISPR-associated protein Csd1